MISSMTGYGRARRILNDREITVEIKSVNSRYFEYSSRLPRAYAWMEDKLKKLAAEKIVRGKAELSLTVVDTGAQDEKVSVNIGLAESYYRAMQQLSQNLNIPNDAAASTISRYDGVLTVSSGEADEKQIVSDVSSVAAEALSGFLSMRKDEGIKMEADIRQYLDHLEEMTEQIEKLSEGRVQVYTDRLYEKLKKLLADRTIDDARVLTEAAIFADRTAVDEELARLRSHIAQFRSILAAGGPAGRKLDFLTQELNREANTIGSKSPDLSVTHLVLDMKNEIEKIREQIQNIE